MAGNARRITLKSWHQIWKLRLSCVGARAARRKKDLKVRQMQQRISRKMLELGVASSGRGKRRGSWRRKDGWIVGLASWREVGRWGRDPV